MFLEGIDLFKDWILPNYYKTTKVPYGLLFPTRPLLPKDLFWLRRQDVLIKHCDKVTNSFRGYDSKLYNRTEYDGVEVVSVDNDKFKQPKIALVNMVTNNDEVAISLNKSGKSKTGNLRRLCDIIELVNNILRKEKDLSADCRTVCGKWCLNSVGY